MKTLNVLLVDDDDVFLDVIEGLLRVLGVERIERASSGLDAYAVLKKQDCAVNCVLCDIAMAQGTGLELLQIVRSGTARPLRLDLTFILVTAMESEEMRDTARKLGANGFLLKPVSIERLREAIQPSRFRDVFQPIRHMLER